MRAPGLNLSVPALLAIALLVGCSSSTETDAPERSASTETVGDGAGTASGPTVRDRAAEARGLAGPAVVGVGGRCPEAMVRIEGGAWLLGLKSPSQPWHEPRRTVQGAAFCIDRFEYPGVEGTLPRAFVDALEAAALCAGAGKRLCSSDEWERACRGPQGERAYAYGSDRVSDACNTPLQTSASMGSKGVPVAPAGSHPRCRSPEGVFDLNGNLSEWVADRWFQPPDPSSPGTTAGTAADPTVYRTVRGGTMWSDTFYGQSCLSRHGHPAEGARFNDDGFRCCGDLDPPG